MNRDTILFLIDKIFEYGNIADGLKYDQIAECIKSANQAALDRAELVRNAPNVMNVRSRS